MLQPTAISYSRIVHGLAVALTVAVFPLIWVGGLVTTYDAGMAVPDWPNTYGYNMFSYPASTWLFGPFDLLVEHSHRLLGTVAGLISIGLVVAAWSFERRSWFKWWAVFVLFSVIAQGALGGFRVLLDQRSFAMIHGCTGPLFFAIATATAVMSSRWWLAQADLRRPPLPELPDSHLAQMHCASPGAARLAAALLITSYLQLIIGAQLRHITAAVDHRVFMGFVHTHLTLAAAVVILAICLATMTGLSRLTPRQVSLPAALLAAVVLLQITLGIGTWIVNYALPWQELSESLARYTIVAKGYWESTIVTAHMATGSLIISLATVTALRARRSRGPVVAKEVNRKWKQQLA
jgi:cytochrome c oxidase assembly protein subunit 15